MCKIVHRRHSQTCRHCRAPSGVAISHVRCVVYSESLCGRCCMFAVTKDTVWVVMLCFQPVFQMYYRFAGLEYGQYDLHSDFGTSRRKCSVSRRDQRSDLLRCSRWHRQGTVMFIVFHEILKNTLFPICFLSQIRKSKLSLSI